MKKKINIVLIVSVIGLWGTIAFKTINRYFFLNQNENEKEYLNNNIKLNKIKKDTFILETLPRDPFLNKINYSIRPMYKKTNTSISSFKKNFKITNKPKTTSKIWPIISYNGYIKGKREIALLNINKKLYKLGLNEQTDGITVKKIFNDSVEIVFNQEKKIIRLNKISNP